MKNAPIRLVCLAVLFLLVQTVSLAGAEWNADTQEEVERIIATEMARRRIPGLSIAIGVGDASIWSRGYGFADLENFVPVTEQSVFRLASISKPITAIAFLQQVEAGKANLDEDIRTYVPSFPKKRWRITPRQLLGHLGGVRSYEGNETLSTKHYWNVADGLEMFAADPLAHEPGTKYLYSSFGFNLAGAATEAVAGVPFRELLATRIFAPAGMTHTRDDHHFALIPRRVNGYRKTKDGEIENCPLADTSNKVPGGGLIASASDLVRFGRAILDGKLVSESSRTLMWTPQSTADGKRTSYGLGWNISTVDGKARAWHGGGQAGTATFFDMVPEERVVVAILTNLEGSGPREIADQVLDVLLNQERVLPTREQ